MTLPTNGPLAMSAMNNEMQLTPNSQLDMGYSLLRSVFQNSGGAINFGSGYGKFYQYSIDMVVIGGGGAGGYGAWGGGGGGGEVYTASLTLSRATVYNVVIGAGGTASTSPTNGLQSTFSSPVATLATARPGQASPGYSGGTSGNGNSGYPQYGHGGWIAGGGGGAGGGAGSATGGSGAAWSVNGTYYGGGGGGSAYNHDWLYGTHGGAGVGGGGQGGQWGYWSAQPGTPNTGGGGGGGYGSTAYSAWVGQNGGSGLVILRYASTTQFATGGTVTTPGDGYVYHTFTSSTNYTA